MTNEWNSKFAGEILHSDGQFKSRKLYRDHYVDKYAEGINETGFHATDCMDIIQKLQIHSVVDVGTGDGRFPRYMKDNGCELVYGSDWEHPMRSDPDITWFHKKPSWDIPLPDNSVEWVTSFDHLEHLFYADIPKTLKEHTRVAAVGIMHKVAFHQACGFHNIVQPCEWWIESFISACPTTGHVAAVPRVGHGTKSIEPAHLKGQTVRDLLVFTYDRLEPLLDFYVN